MITESPQRGEPDRDEVQEHFRLLADSVMDHAFHTLDAAGRVATWNRGAERLFGYSADEILGLPFERFFPQAAQARHQGHRQVGVDRLG